MLRRHAGMGRQALLDEWIATGHGGEDGDWLGEHLLRCDPAATFRALGAQGLDTTYVVSSWSLWDPEHALPLLMAGRPPFAINRLGYDSRLRFDGIGRENPELGLKWLLELPPELPIESRGPHVWSQPGSLLPSQPFTQLLAGVAASHPEKVYGIFKQIADAHAMPASQLAPLLPSLVQSDPAKAMEWAKQRHSTLSPAVAAGLVEGLADRDLAAATAMFPEIKDRDHAYKAASKISRTMARDNSQLDESLAWIDANLPPDLSRSLKRDTTATWIRAHPEDAFRRLASGSALEENGFAHEAKALLQMKAKEGKLPGLLENLSAQEAAALRRLSGEESPVEKGNSVELTSERLLAGMRSAPEDLDELWAAVPEANQAKVLNDLVDGDTASRDPERSLRFLLRYPERLASSSAQLLWNRLIQVDPQAAVRLVDSMPAEARKPELIEGIVNAWSADDAAAALAWQKRISGVGQ